MDFSIHLVKWTSGKFLKFKILNPRVAGDQLRTPLMYFVGIASVIFVFNADDRSTFDCLSSLIKTIQQITDRFKSTPPCCFYLIGIRDDSSDPVKREVTNDIAYILADDYGLRYFSVDLSDAADEVIQFTKWLMSLLTIFTDRKNDS